MQKINIAKCVGCFKKTNFKDKTTYYRSHFIYDVIDDNTGEPLGQAVFTTYDQCKVGECYQFASCQGQAFLISD